MRFRLVKPIDGLEVGQTYTITQDIYIASTNWDRIGLEVSVHKPWGLIDSYSYKNLENFLEFWLPVRVVSEETKQQIREIITEGVIAAMKIDMSPLNEANAGLLIVEGTVSAVVALIEGEKL